MLSTHSFVVWITLYHLLSSTCQRKRDTLTLYPARWSQHMLFTRRLNNGHGRPPSGEQEQAVTGKPLLDVRNLLLILLLTGDVELNPGPVPDVPPPQLAKTQTLSAQQLLLQEQTTMASYTQSGLCPRNPIFKKTTVCKSIQHP